MIEPLPCARSICCDRHVQRLALVVPDLGRRHFPNTPAERGGVRAGDRILAVDGQSTRG
jgi:hypothetical protein